MPVSHRKYSTASEGADASLVRTSDWNATHRLSAEVDIDGDFDPTLLARLTFRNNSDRVLTFGQNMTGHMIFTRYLFGTAVGEPITINIANGAVTLEGMDTDLKSAIAAKVPAVTTGLQVYATTGGGVQTTVRYEDAKGTASLIYRNASTGRADIQTPLADNPDGIANVAFVQAAGPNMQKTPLGDSAETTTHLQSFLDTCATLAATPHAANAWRAAKVTFNARTRLIPTVVVKTAPGAPTCTLMAGLYALGGSTLRPLDRVLDLGTFSCDTVAVVPSSVGAVWVEAGEYYLVWTVYGSGTSSTGNLLSMSAATNATANKQVIDSRGAAGFIVHRWSATLTNATPTMPATLTAPWTSDASAAVCPVFFRIP